MKKRMISLLLCLAMILSEGAIAFAGSEEASAERTLKTLGIMTGDEKGNMNLDRYVTRAQLAKMLCAASAYKDTVGENGLGYSLYSDVRGNHWASEYIKVCTQMGWMTGYSNGTFRPDATVKIEEACSAILKLLGYQNLEMAGAYPYAQLSKASSLGITDHVTAARGTLLTRRDVMMLFYQTLTAKTAQGQTYATTLGYQVVNGQVSYTSVVGSNLSGPYVASEQTKLDFAPLQVYLNGDPSANRLPRLNEVYYYDKGSKTLWIYNKKTSGKIDAVQPAAAPSAVVIAGNTYQIQSADVSYQMSSYGSLHKGDTVTLLLGMDDMAAGVLSGDQVHTDYVGVVLSNLHMADEGKPSSMVTLACTDGINRSFTVAETNVAAGKIACVTVGNDSVKLTAVSDKTLSGKVNKAATTLGDYALAEQVNIIDVDGTTAVKIDAEELSGVTLSADHIQYYALNGNEITDLVLKNATGKTWQYGYLLNVQQVDVMMQMSGSYTYLMNGNVRNVVLTDRSFKVQQGGFALRYDADGQLDQMKQLEKVSLTDVSGSFAFAGNIKYDMADDVQVLLKSGDNYMPMAAEDLDPDTCIIKGFYDDFGCPAGGKIRVILAEKKI
ncbi:MAG: S-layer homology domain-containing protein [Firmicutes bacterium]|nr:S-layer homology domain-containing protein [Bacillota bacterium]